MGSFNSTGGHLPRHVHFDDSDGAESVDKEEDSRD
jgi:hypothetical protein